MEECIKLVGYGVDTLILNVRYSDSKAQPVKQELNEKLLQELDYLQGEARRVETAVATDWAFQDVLLFVEPHGVGKQWRWLLTSRLTHSSRFAWEIQQYHCTSALLVGVPLVASVVW